VIQDVVKTIGPMATKNGNRLVIDFPSDLGTIHADQTRFPAIRSGERAGVQFPRATSPYWALNRFCGMPAVEKM
jgi:hypothetical protein